MNLLHFISLLWNVPPLCDQSFRSLVYWLGVCQSSELRTSVRTRYRRYHMLWLAVTSCVSVLDMTLWGAEDSQSDSVWLLILCPGLCCNISYPPSSTRMPRAPPASCQICFSGVFVTERLAGFILLTVSEDSCSVHLLLFCIFSLLPSLIAVVDVKELCEAPWQCFISFFSLCFIFFVLSCLCHLVNMMVNTKRSWREWLKDHTAYVLLTNHTYFTSLQSIFQSRVQRRCLLGWESFGRIHTDEDLSNASQAISYSV